MWPEKYFKAFLLIVKKSSVKRIWGGLQADLDKF